ncbi:MAG: LUD domain-containing protein [Pirellulales bacterium]
MNTLPETASSKQAILQQVRQNGPPATELPSLEEDWIRYEDPCAQFMEMVQQVGGQAIRVKDRQASHACLAELEIYQQAKKVVSLLPDMGRIDVDLGQVARSHELEDVDVTIARGELAVAENGAVWVSGANLEHRAILFLCQHLVLVVSLSAVVHNMHQAYDRLTDQTDQHSILSSSSYGLFISGPSKTADIEQSLVIGAQGPRSLTVLLEEYPPTA